MEMLPGARFRIRPEPGAAAWWGDPPGSLTSGWSTVCLGPGPWDFSPGTAGALRKAL